MPDDPHERDASPMAKADLVTAAVLLALGLAMLYGGYTMDRLEVRRIHPLSIPGLVPMGLGAALCACAALLLAGALRAGALRQRWRPAPTGGLARLSGALALCLAYPLVLIGRLPFWLATALFVTAFLAGFEWRARAPLPHLRALATAAAQGLIVGLVTAYVFAELFLVRLP